MTLDESDKRFDYFTGGPEANAKYGPKRATDELWSDYGHNWVEVGKEGGRVRHDIFVSSLRYRRLRTEAPCTCPDWSNFGHEPGCPFLESRKTEAAPVDEAFHNALEAARILVIGGKPQNVTMDKLSDLFDAARTGWPPEH